MGYTPEKITSGNLKLLILNAIKERLDQHPDIGQNDSVAYYGVHASFDINLTLISRATVNTTVRGQRLIGDPSAARELEKTGELRIDNSRASGKVHKGKAEHATNKTGS